MTKCKISNCENNKKYNTGDGWNNASDDVIKCVGNYNTGEDEKTPRGDWSNFSNLKKYYEKIGINPSPSENSKQKSM